MCVKKGHDCNERIDILIKRNPTQTSSNTPFQRRVAGATIISGIAKAARIMGSAVRLFRPIQQVIQPKSIMERENHLCAVLRSNDSLHLV
jgi:hypothetical protein